MLRVGITGGIGSGKTAVTDWLAQKGITIVDADVVARLVGDAGDAGTRRDRPKLLAPSISYPDGQLDRAALRQLVFADESKRKVLEGDYSSENTRGAGEPVAKRQFSLRGAELTASAGG
jgi:dephospho-CoA kinase